VRPQLLTLKDAAIYLGLTDWALRERVWQGSIPFVRFSGSRKQYFHIKDLDSFIEENKARYVQYSFNEKKSLERAEISVEPLKTSSATYL
jgi:excisionase family DNA binding protein